MSALGRHILVEFFGCNPEIMNDVITIETSMVDAAREATATVINSTFHHFSPYGVSGVVVIQESHLAIHTWPEFGYAAVDVFTCGDSVDPWVCYDYLLKAFEAKNGSAMELKRGQTSLLERSNFSLDTGTMHYDTGLQTEVQAEYKRDVWFTDKNDDIALSLRHTGELLYRAKTPFQTVQVLNTHAYGKMLTIDDLVMCTEKDEFVYHEMITHPTMQLHKNPKNVLVIGGGDGGTVREIVKYSGLKKVTMVEIDEKVVEASKLHLPTLASAFGHEKLELLFDDGIAFVANSPAAAYDVIIVDGSDPRGPAEGLFSESFFANCKRCLKPDGILVTQSEGPHFNQKAMVEMHQCFKTIFGNDKVHTYLAFIPTYPTGMWTFTMCTMDDVNPRRDIKESEADRFGAANGFKYYNSDVHFAAFALPNFVKDMLAGK
jgi:spermidine synthase